MQYANAGNQACLFLLSLHKIAKDIKKGRGEAGRGNWKIKSISAGLGAVARERIQGGGGSDYDVIALVKQWMADGELSQNPLLVVPHTLQPKVMNFFRFINTEDPGPLQDVRHLSRERSNQLELLALFLIENYDFIYQAAADYLRTLAKASEWPSPPRLRWLQHAFQADMGQRFTWDREPDAAFVPHQLQVRFRNGPARVLA